MRLAEYLSRDTVQPALNATSKREVLDELVRPLVALHTQLHRDEVLRVLLDREQLGTTGIGGGIAIPHGKLAGLEEIVLSVGRSPDGVAFDALDGQPCTIFFLVLAPEQAAGMHLRILAHISRLLREDPFRQSFLSAENTDALYDLLASH